MIEYVYAQAALLWGDLQGFLASNFDPFRDTLDLVVVFLAIYWLLLLIKGTRAVQILIGLLALIAVKLVADLFQLLTVQWILNNFLGYAVLIIIILFQADIRRALARVGRGVFPRAEGQQSEILEEIVRAAQALSQRGMGALIVLERETGLEDLVQVGRAVDALVSKELLVSIFLPQGPLHDGAVIVQEGHIAYAGCILPLTLRTDLPEGLGTRHRAAVGITEETDAVVIVASEETRTLSVVAAGEITQGLDAPALRGALRDVMSRGRRGAEEEEEPAATPETPAATPADAPSSAGGS